MITGQSIDTGTRRGIDGLRKSWESCLKDAQILQDLCNDGVQGLSCIIRRALWRSDFAPQGRRNIPRQTNRESHHTPIRVLTACEGRSEIVQSEPSSWPLMMDGTHQSGPLEFRSFISFFN